MGVTERERLQWRDTPHPLGRHVNHDARSKAYPHRAAPRRALKSVRHERHVPVFDQGSLGSCTGNAAIGCLATGRFFRTVDEMDHPNVRTLDQAAAVWVYSAATRIDPFRGEHPPEDTGSDGLSVARVLHQAGAIAGYRHAFSLADTLDALQDGPLITGTVWLNDMFRPNSDGIVRPTGSEQGGHEYLVDEYDGARGLVGFTNSWGPNWGQGGRFYMQAEDFGTLLSRQGDVTVFVPCTEPAPEPVAADPDAVLAAAVGTWAKRDAICGRKHRRAIVDWMTAKGL